MARTSLQLRSKISAQGQLELSLASVEVADPGPDEVVVRVEASPPPRRGPRRVLTERADPDVSPEGSLYFLCPQTPRRCTGISGGCA